MWYSWVFRLWKNRKCRKKLVDKFVEECTETVKEVKVAKITLSEDKNKHKCSSCTLYIALFLILFTINTEIGTYFIYFHWYFKKDVTYIRFSACTQTVI